MSEAPPRWLVLLLATSCGLIVANIYYAQPLVGPISAAIGLSPHAAGLIVTMSQIGYGVGLLLVVPMGDLFENRSLILAIIGVGAASLAAASLSTAALPFLVAAGFIGLGSVAVQVLVPYASHLAPEAVRGRVVGNVTSGLMLGIMLARPAASFVADLFSWNAVFVLGAVVMAGLAVVLRVALPVRMPAANARYARLVGSMGRLLIETPVLRRRAAYQACLFGTFSLFWTTVPLLLADRFQLSQSGIALFALAGVAGAVSAPIAGRMADRGWSRPMLGLAIAGVALAFLLARSGQSAGGWRLAVLVFSAILLDFGVTASLVLGQRAIFTLGAEYRSRLNGLYMALFFIGGAVGSALGGWTYAQGGWLLTCWAGLALPVLALLYWAMER